MWSISLDQRDDYDLLCFHLNRNMNQRIFYKTYHFKIIWTAFFILANYRSYKLLFKIIRSPPLHHPAQSLIIRHHQAIRQQTQLASSWANAVIPEIHPSQQHAAPFFTASHSSPPYRTKHQPSTIPHFLVPSLLTVSNSSLGFLSNPHHPSPHPSHSSPPYLTNHKHRTIPFYSVPSLLTVNHILPSVHRMA